MWKEILRAARYAKRVHKGQIRAHGTPYFTHPAAVARYLWEYGIRDSTIITAAYLHDTIEDCGETYTTLVKRFGAETAELVLTLTKRPGEPREAYFNRIKAAGPEAIMLKVADRAHNNSELALAPTGCTELRRKAELKTALMLKIFIE